MVDHHRTTAIGAPAPAAAMLREKDTAAVEADLLLATALALNSE